MRGALRRSVLPFGGVILFIAMSFSLLAFRNEQVDIEALSVGIILVAMVLAQYVFVPLLFNKVDKALLISVNMLAAIGLVMLYRLEPSSGVKQMVWYGVGLVAMVVITAVVRRMDAPEGGVWLFAGVGVGLLLLSIIFGSVIGGAQNWIKLKSIGVSIQPSEFTKVFLVLALASIFREKRRFLGYMPALIFTGICLVLLVLSKDLGAALLYFFVFLVMMYCATSSVLWTGVALGAFSGAAVVSYHLFDHVRLRVAVWQNPWAVPNAGGYQIVQGLTAIVSGGPVGSGLGLGSPRWVPAYQTDYVFSSICEEMGIFMGVLVIAFYIYIVIRGLRIASNAENKFFSLLALGCTVSLGIQAFIILGGVLKMIPLTGITLPFISYGGSSMLVSMIFIGILQAVAVRNDDQDMDDEDYEEEYEQMEYDEEEMDA